MPTVVPSSYICTEEDSGAPLWQLVQLEEMDRRFSERMLAAVAAGAERCATTSISTTPCTRYPVANYRRPE
jgi:hypothetical protein